MVDDPSAPVIIHSVAVPNTGGWQTWKSVSASGNLTKGPHTIRVFIKKAEFNINWLKISLVTSISSIVGSKRIEVYPNPVKDLVCFNTAGFYGHHWAKITSLQGVVVKQFAIELKSGLVNHADISELTDGVYIFSIENKSEKHYCRFIKAK